MRRPEQPQIGDSGASSRCFFCGRHPPHEPDAVLVPMYKELDRHDVWGGVEVHYITSTITVPRCQHCAAHHRGFVGYSISPATGRIVAAFWLLVAVVFTAGAAMDRNWKAAVIGFVLFNGLGIPFLFCARKHPQEDMDAQFEQEHGVRPRMYYKAREYEGIAQAIEQGWHLGKSPAWPLDGLGPKDYSEPS